jgi:hypothetical protein
MRRSVITALIVAMLLIGFPPMQQTASADHGFQISFGFFYHRLSPYGRWVHFHPYGWVWYPLRVRRHWQPYCDDGYWAYTEYGYTWVSYYDWGYIPLRFSGGASTPSAGTGC